MRQEERTPVKKKRSPRRRLSNMQIAVIVLGVVVFLAAAAFGGYVLYENEQYQKALRNYPVAYTDFIKTYSTEYKLDPYLVQSIMRCESSNDPSVVSKVGAIGLMQIMPDTGTWIAHTLVLDTVYTEKMMYETEKKNELGCWY